MHPEEALEAWKEIQAQWPLVAEEIARRQRQTLSLLADRGQTADIDDVRGLQGQLEALKTLLRLPEIKIQELEGQLNAKR